MKLKHEISSLDKTQIGFYCVFKKADMLNTVDPFNPPQKCMLYLIMGEDKPNCEECKVNYITINVEE